jgi:hypothetical protein
MKLVNVKTARFAEVVEKCGAPQPYTLWQKPRADATLQKLLVKNRIMTIRRGNGSADFGEVGLHERTGSSYLAFPKSLQRFAGKRIVGIKWDLVQS